ncbi:MAG: hypothetical protein Q8941_15955 [Bacteroidota bacterium]|nr:hypothetical protein [Bacteroidota bacterium]
MEHSGQRGEEHHLINTLTMIIKIHIRQFSSCLVLCICSFYASFSQKPLDDIFVSWNRASLLSLKTQRDATTDSIQSRKYENRLRAFQNYLEIENEQTINIKSVRYELLKKVSQLPDFKNSNYFIVEANVNSYTLVIRSFVIGIDANRQATVYIYTNNGKWEKKQVCSIANLNIGKDLKIYKTRYGKGSNHDDIIITSFIKGYVFQSEYFINYTLYQQNFIDRIFSCDSTDVHRF